MGDHIYEIRRHIYDDLMIGLGRYFAQIEMPSVVERDHVATYELLLNSSQIHIKAQSMTAGIMQILDKHLDELIEEMLISPPNDKRGE